MEFRLTYQGELYATQRDPICGQRDPRAANKHVIRQALHKQLKRLWDITPFLKAGEGSGANVVAYGGAPIPKYDITTLANRYALYGFNFVPLVTADLDLYCELEILFLRPDKPGSVVWGGDIDNRLKTLLDTLRIPLAGEDYSKNQTPSPSERPFFCLLEDDKLITKLSVETDQLLEPIKDQYDPACVRLVITVRLRPWETNIGNMQFG